MLDGGLVGETVHEQDAAVCDRGIGRLPLPPIADAELRLPVAQLATQADPSRCVVVRVPDAVRDRFVHGQHDLVVAVTQRFVPCDPRTAPSSGPRFRAPAQGPPRYRRPDSAASVRRITTSAMSSI